MLARKSRAITQPAALGGINVAQGVSPGKLSAKAAPVYPELQPCAGVKGRAGTRLTARENGISYEEYRCPIMVQNDL